MLKSLTRFIRRQLWPDHAALLDELRAARLRLEVVHEEMVVDLTRKLEEAEKKFNGSNGDA